MATNLRKQLTTSAVLWAFIALAAWLYAWHPIRCDDQWWHLLTGRYVLEHGSVPETDPFSFTFQGQPWVNWEWLSGVLMASAWKLAGPWGLVALRWLAMVLTIFAMWRHLCRDGAVNRPWLRTLSLLLLALSLLVVFGRATDRPHLYALPFLAVTHLLSVRAADKLDPRPVAALLVLMGLWVLIHPSWVLGVAVHGAVTADRLIAEVRARRRARHGDAESHSRSLRWTVAAKLYAFSPLLLLVPPLILHDPAQYGTALRNILTSSSLSEWKSLSHYLHYQNLPLIAFLILATAWLLSVGLHRKQLGRLYTWLLAAALVNAWLHVRFTSSFAVLVAPVLFRQIRQRWGDDPLPERTSKLVGWLVALLLVFATVDLKSTYVHSYSAAVDSRENPVAVQRFMGRHALAGNVFANRLNANAYLAFRRYPKVRIFIDGRVPQLFPESFLTEFFSACNSPPAFARLLDQSPIEHVVLMEMLSKPTAGLAGVLGRRPDFELLYFDDYTMLWTKSRVLQDLPSRPAAFRILNPALIGDSWFDHALSPQAFPILIEELNRLLAYQPGSRIARALITSLLRSPAASPAQRQILTKFISPDELANP